MTKHPAPEVTRAESEEIMLIGFGWFVGVFMSGVIVWCYVVACLIDFILGRYKK